MTEIFELEVKSYFKQGEGEIPKQRVTVRLEVDVINLVARLGTLAAKSKLGKSNYLGGLIKVGVITRQALES